MSTERIQLIARLRDAVEEIIIRELDITVHPGSYHHGYLDGAMMAAREILDCLNEMAAQ